MQPTSLSLNTDFEPQRRAIHLFVLIDALGWEFIRDRDFLNDLLPYRQPLRTVLGFSSGAIPTILTGRPPAENGHWNLFYYDPVHSPFRWLRYFSWLPKSVLDDRVSRKVVKELGRRVLGMGPLFECCVSPRLMPWFNWVEKRNIYSAGGISGAKSVFDRMAERRTGYRVYTYHQFRDSEIIAHAKHDIETSDASFFFLYLSEIDNFLHHYCHEPARIDAELNLYANWLRDLHRQATRLSPDVTLTVFSDHGMTPVSNHYPLAEDIDKLGLNAPGEYLCVYDSTMARFWFFDDRAKTKIIETLDNNPCGRILSRTELQELGLGFADDRYGQIIFLMNPGWLISQSDFNGPGWQPLGMHGYHPDDPYSDAIFLTNRKPRTKMETIGDIHGCMVDALA